MGSQLPTPTLDQITLARALPSGLAYLASRGKWRPAKHLNILAERLVDLEQRRITRLLVEMPPRHGKSELCSHFFPPWYLGRHPDEQIVLASYESNFAQLWGERSRDVIAEYGPQVFGHRLHPRKRSAGEWRIEGHAGSMRSTGATGGLTGRGAHVLIVDDPIKDALEASSPVYRQRIWDWFQTTASTRVEPDGIIIVIQTRWHQEDLIGRLRRQAELGGEQWHSVTLPALCEDPATDLMGRQLGEALWEKRWSAEFLRQRKAGMPSHWWNALFQQRPTPPGGSLAQTLWFPVIRAAFPGIPKRVRFWDVASTDPKKQAKAGDPDWTVGLLMARYPDGKYVIEDVRREQKSSGDVEKMIVQQAMRDGYDVAIREEQEGGSSGVAVINSRKKALAGFNYQGTKALGKPGGWTPILIQAEVGFVYVMAGPWNTAFFAEVGDVPYGSHDDQMDAAAGAFHFLSIGSGLRAADLLSIGSEPEEQASAMGRRQF